MNGAYLLVVAAAFCAVAAVCRGQSAEFDPLGRDLPVDDLQKQLRIQMEWIELDQADLTRIMADPELVSPSIYKSADDGPLRRHLAKLIEEKKATLLDTAIVISRSGQRAKTESVQEVIYPTEFDPPELFAPETGGEKEEESDGAKDLPLAASTAPNPTAWETRNIGTTFEVDPVIGVDGVTIDLNLSSEMVFLTGRDKWKTTSERGGQEVGMPLFYTMRITTAATMKGGQPVMIGVKTPPDPATGLPKRDRKVLVFVKADILIVGLETD